jgi:tetratricopeptide (TPR) repeat protein
MSAPILSRFTPSLLSSEDLEAVFVQRHALAERLIEQIRESTLSAAKHHNLLIGPRGIGKTHLVALIYHRIASMNDLRDRLRIAWLREEEWGVTSLLDLLLRILRALREEYPEELPEDRIEALYQEPPAHAERLAITLLREMLRGKTLLLMVENLDDLFLGLGAEGQQAFRAFLQEGGDCTILATAPRLFSGIKLQNSPFYGFFRVQHLAEFSFEDAALLLERIARLRGQDDLANFIQTPTGRARIRAIHHLASGCPRIYVILSEFLSRESLDELVPPFMRMLDDLTPYYQARMAWLSPQQRKIVEFLVDYRAAATVKEIAKRCFMTQQTASSQLNKLSEMGYVVSQASGRESFYELRESLMRFCLEIKKQRRQPIRLFVDFLRLWCTRDELETRLLSLLPEEEIDKQYVSHALEAAKQDANDPRVTACFKDYLLAYEKDDAASALTAAEELTVIRGDAHDFVLLSICLIELNRLNEALIAAEAALERDSESSFAYYIRSKVLLSLDRFEEALKSAEIAIKIDPTNPYTWGDKGAALQKLNRISESIEAYTRASEIAPKESGFWLDRARVEFLSKDVPAARKSLQRALRLEPGSTAGKRFQVMLLIAETKFTQAISVIDQLNASNTDDPTGLIISAALRAATHRWEEVVPLLERSAEIANDKAFVKKQIERISGMFNIGSYFSVPPESVIKDLIAFFARHDALPSLLSGLLSDLNQIDPLPDAWLEQAQKVISSTDSEPLLRLVQTALEYKKSGDPKLLLTLPIEERRLIQLALEPEEKTTAEAKPRVTKPKS